MKKQSRVLRASARPRFDRIHRDRLLRGLDDPAQMIDLLIIGGGITGVGAALDAAQRGLSVVLIEKDDLASGTSSRSSKLIHGGLRYLEQLDFPLVREALRERGRLLSTIAPHLVTPVPFVLPLRHRIWERAYLGAGVALYDRLGGARHVPRASHLGRRALARRMPSLRSDDYIGGVRFWDAQTDDARLVVEVARTAIAHGARIATRVRAERFRTDDGRVVGATVVDGETGRSFDIRARHVATAVGAWSDGLVAGHAGSAAQLRPSKGAHIVLPPDAIESDSGILARTDTGLLFVIPWYGYWLVGDTDTDWSGAPEDARAERADVTTLLDRLNSIVDRHVSPAEIIGTFAGIRPLVAADADAATTQLSREHAISHPVPGLTSITGGKLTTYRLMAEQLVDAAVAEIGMDVGRSRTAITPLLGAEGFADLWADRSALADASGLPLERIEMLLQIYGSRTLDLLELIERDARLALPLHAAPTVIAAQIVYACSHEGALHLDDVLERRTRLSLLVPEGGAAVVDEVVALMQQALGWSDARTEAERTAART